jgi:L-amino acid N-acyltransferase YncA
VRIRTASDDDWPAIWPLWHAIVAAGETYVWSDDTTCDEARQLWMLPPPAEVVVLEDDEGVVRGSAVLKPNQPGRGDHVANAGFMVDPDRGGHGIGRRLAEQVLREARADGYRAMQFNAVVETNTGAVALWRSLGFEVLATVPEAFDHPRHGLVGLHVMHRRL